MFIWKNGAVTELNAALGGRAADGQERSGEKLLRSAERSSKTTRLSFVLTTPGNIPQTDNKPVRTDSKNTN